MLQKKLADPAVTFAKKRPLIWGRLFTSPGAASSDLLRFVDVTVPDFIDTGSLVTVGDSYAVLDDVGRRGIGRLAPLMTAAANPAEPLEDSQVVFLGLTAGDAIGKDLPLVRAYIARFQSRARKQTDKASLSQVEAIAVKRVLRADLGPVIACTPVELEGRWKRRPAEIVREFPPPALARYKPDGRPETEALAQQIVDLSEIGGGTHLGLFDALLDKVGNDLFKEVKQNHLRYSPVTEQLQKVKRVLLLLAMLHHARVTDILAQRLEERIVLDDPDGTEPFREVDIADLCVEYGDGIIDPIMNFVGSSTGDDLSDAAIKKHATVLLRACGDTPADRAFLQMYIERKTKLDQNVSLRRLVRAIGDLTLENGK